MSPIVQCAMSDLNDFFAKKDRKKKKAATRSPVTSAPSEGKKSESSTETNVSAPAPKQPDDGWIEIEDPKGAQVNTGGRTVVEFKRCGPCINIMPWITSPMTP